MKIDFHNHFYPTEYLKKLEEWGHRYEFTYDAKGLKIVKEKGARFLGLTPQMEVAEKIYSELQAAGVEVMLDDRNERPGVKFKDADLIGFPIQVIIGAKLAQDKLEIKLRIPGYNIGA